MPAKVILGLQWGDEGKGKIVDLLSESADLIVRYQGGQNAGHTIVVGGHKTVLHLVPSGVLHHKKCLLGNGMVIDPVGLYEEMCSFDGKSFDAVAECVLISDRAHLLFPYHKLRDSLDHSKKIGTTGRGIGPAYEDKVGRKGYVFQKLKDVEKLIIEIQAIYQADGGNVFDIQEYLNKLRDCAPKLLPLMVNGADYINTAYEKGQQIILEGAQGTWLDIDHGTYPFVTSSNTTIGGACTGSGLPPQRIDAAIGVMKAYTTRVGAGRFPTELTDDLGDYIRSQGKEFGATTGRPRRVGWLDLVVLKQAIRLNGIEELAMMKMDVLDEIAEIKVATKYEFEGKEFDLFPSDLEVLEKLQPIYQPLSGWQSKTVGVKTFDELPVRAQDYVTFIENYLKIPIRWVSTGPERDETVVR